MQRGRPVTTGDVRILARWGGEGLQWLLFWSADSWFSYFPESSVVNGFTSYLSCDLYVTYFMCQRYLPSGKAGQYSLTPSLEASVTDQTLQCSQEFRNKQSLLKEFPIPDEWNVLRQASRSTGKEQKSRGSPRWTPSIFYLLSGVLGRLLLLLCWIRVWVGILPFWTPGNEDFLY